ncbi:MAG TPA: phosphate propanoyltransferase [Thermotogota bacterium]|nr:phosphate propanoyltransferase [Thermotogota bacterium]HRW91923.1 phosphate propanoyltransferase [Thermotogota bacterium]
MKSREGKIMAGVSARHLHVSENDLKILFGEDARLTPVKDLGQPGQYACAEKVSVVGPKGSFEGVRILGPTRKSTQVEVSRTDAFKLGINPPVRDSGDVAGSPGAKLVGPKGEVDLSQGVIIAKRHIHMTTEDAGKLGVKDKQLVSVFCDTQDRKAVLMDVLVRVSDSYALEFHVDTDEANAVNLKTGDMVQIVEEC